MLKIVGATSTFGSLRREGRHSVGREDVTRLKDLERENATLKRFLADVELERVAVKELGVSEQFARWVLAGLAAPLRKDHPRSEFRPAYHNARAQGWAVNHEAIQCLWREDGLRVPQRRRKG